MSGVSSGVEKIRLPHQIQLNHYEFCLIWHVVMSSFGVRRARVHVTEDSALPRYLKIAVVTVVGSQFDHLTSRAPLKQFCEVTHLPFNTPLLYPIDLKESPMLILCLKKAPSCSQNKNKTET